MRNKVKYLLLFLVSFIIIGNLPSSTVEVKAVNVDME